jgi:hypothetical protein
VTFTWKKAETKRTYMGVIAQTVQYYFPEAVTENADGYLSVDYAVLVAPLIQAVKELAHKVAGHDARIEELEKQNALLKQQNEAILKRLEVLERAPASDVR